MTSQALYSIALFWVKKLDEQQGEIIEEHRSQIFICDLHACLAIGE